MPQCRNCGRIGHIEKFCYRNQICGKCSKRGHTEKVCREVLRYQTSYLDSYEDDNYRYHGNYEGYNVERYNDEYCDTYYGDYEEDNECYDLNNMPSHPRQTRSMKRTKKGLANQDRQRRQKERFQ
jgi:hypothetical protein